MSGFIKMWGDNVQRTGKREISFKHYMYRVKQHITYMVLKYVWSKIHEKLDKYWVNVRVIEN